MKLIILIWTLILFTTQIKSIFNIKTTKEAMDKDKDIMSNKNFSTNSDVIYVFVFLVVFLYYFLCGIFINTFVFSIICFSYCIWKVFDTKNIVTYLKEDKVSRTLDSKLYRIISKPFNIGFSLYMIYFIAIHW